MKKGQQELNDKGDEDSAVGLNRGTWISPMKRAWADYLGKNIPHDFPQDKVEVAQEAFFAGALAMGEAINMLVKVCPWVGDESTSELAIQLLVGKVDKKG